MKFALCIHTLIYTECSPLRKKKKNSYLIIKCPSNVHLFFVQSFDEHSNSSPSRLERPPEESPFGKISSRWWCGPKEAQRANSDFNQKSPLDAIHWIVRDQDKRKEGRRALYFPSLSEKMKEEEKDSRSYITGWRE